MLPLHSSHIAAGMRVQVYNGDHDMCVPHTGAEAWTAGLGLPVQDAWRPWYVNKQVSIANIFPWNTGQRKIF